MSFIIGKKIKMDQMWDEKGNVIPVTVVQAGPVVVTQVRTKENDGYSAIQVGFDATKKNINKPLKGHLKELGAFKYLKEFRTTEEKTIGDTVTVEAFQVGEKVKVTGTDKGRGFQGVVKRHGFHGAPKSHGTKDRLRAPGSIGAGGVQRVVKGKKMAGRMGGVRVAVKNLRVAAIDAEKNILFLRGAVPGNKRGIITVEHGK